MAGEIKDLTKKIKQNYQSIILGILVILAGVAVFSRASNTGKQTKNQANEAKQSVIAETEGAYTVQKGDTLWSISEKVYKTGYAWSEIVKANQLISPNIIKTGQKLTLPRVDTQKYMAMQKPTAMTRAEPTTAKAYQKPKKKPAIAATQTGQITIKGTNYKVIRGDHLWSIAVRAFSDGYAWTKIWQANKTLIKNPNLIYPGQVLKLPR